MQLRRARQAMFIALSLALFIQLFARHPVQTFAQTSNLPTQLQMDIAFGFAGRFRPGYWTPMSITLTNHGSPRHVTVAITTRHGSPVPELSHTTTYVHEFHLPAGSPHIVQGQIMLSNAFHPVRIDLLDDQGRAIATETLDLQRRAVDGEIIVALDPTGREWSWLETQTGVHVSTRGQRLGLEIMYLDAPWQLPADWIAYHGVTAVAISSAFPLRLLSDVQLNALRTWVEGGGRLIWAGGHRLEATRSPLAETHLPLNPSGMTRRLEPPFHSERYPAFPLDHDVIVWDIDAVDGDVLAEASGHPIVARANYGLGTAFVMTFDPYSLDVVGWNGIGQLARDMLQGASPMRARLGSPEGSIWRYIQAWQVPYPSRLIPALLLAGYIVCLALMWRRVSRRPKFALASIAITVLAFSLVAWVVLNPITERSHHATSQVAVTLANPDGAGETWLFQFFHSFNREAWHLNGIPSGFTQVPTEQVLIQAREPDTRLVIHPNHTISTSFAPRSFGRFLSLQQNTLPIDASLSARGRDFHLTVTNVGAVGLGHVYYVDSLHYARLGFIGPGEQASYTIASGVQATSFPSPEWLGSAVASDIERSMASHDNRGLSDVIAALIADRQRSGATRLTGDDGFIVGLIDLAPDTRVSPQPTAEAIHIFIVDLQLRGTQL